jgi:hypothetical protein
MSAPSPSQEPTAEVPTTPTTTPTEQQLALLGPAAPQLVRARLLPSDEIFERRTAVILGGVCFVSLLFGLIFSVIAVRDEEGSIGANAFGRSSVGHRALVELLGEFGVDVVVSRFRSAEKSGPEVPLLVAEPLRLFDDTEALAAADADDDSGEGGGSASDEAPAADKPLGDSAGDVLSLSYGLERLLVTAEDRSARTIIVLPKWRGEPSTEKSGWIGQANLLSTADAVDVLELAIGEACPVVRSEAPAPFNSFLPGGTAPTLPFVQLVDSDCSLVPLVANGSGTLIGRAKDRPVYVIADPDLLNTQGLSAGQNAAVVQELFVGELRAKGLVVDEVLHGFGQVPSLWRELFSMPLVPITLHVLALLALAVLAAFGRFGKAEKLPPRVPPGKRALIESTAQLLDGGRHHAESARQYVRAMLRRASTEASLPPGDGPDALLALSTLAKSRGVTVDVTALLTESEALQPGPRSATRALELAALAHRFRLEMKHGHS